jgi:hypothetical protein
MIYGMPKKQAKVISLVGYILVSQARRNATAEK